MTVEDSEASEKSIIRLEHTMRGRDRNTSNVGLAGPGISRVHFLTARSGEKSREHSHQYEPPSSELLTPQEIWRSSH